MPSALPTPALVRAAAIVAVGPARSSERITPGVPSATVTSVELKISNFARCSSDAMTAPEDHPVSTTGAIQRVMPTSYATRVGSSEADERVVLTHVRH